MINTSLDEKMRELEQSLLAFQKTKNLFLTTEEKDTFVLKGLAIVQNYNKEKLLDVLPDLSQDYL